MGNEMTPKERIASLRSDIYRIGTVSVGIDVSWLCNYTEQLIRANENLILEKQAILASHAQDMADAEDMYRQFRATIQNPELAKLADIWDDGYDACDSNEAEDSAITNPYR